MRIETERMWLTPIAESEANALRQIWLEPQVRKYLCDDQLVSFEQVQTYVRESNTAISQNRYGIWVARLKTQPEIIGFTGYWPFFDPPEVQLIYGLSHSYWHQGLATEMAAQMLQYGFQTHKFKVIRASADLPNSASIAVMQRLGMTFDRQETIDGKDLVFYRLAAD